jgi:HemY protein
MSFLIKFIIVLLAGIFFGLLALQDPGYVLISRSPWQVETSLTFFIAALVALFVVMYALFRFIAGSRHMSQTLHNWRQQRRHRRAAQSLNKGLLLLAERQWQQAEKELTRFVTDSESPLLNYLAAASAAQGLNAHDRRDEYLQKAHQSMQSADLAVGLTQAELQLRHKQSEQALATLTRLRELAPKHGHVLKLMMHLYLDLHDWRHLRDLLPELKRRKVVDESELQDLETRVHSELLQSAVKSGVQEVILDIWNQIPKRLRHHETIVSIYVKDLVQRGGKEEAEKLLYDTINKHWNEQLLQLYGDIESDNPAMQLSRAERWLPDHETDAVLLSVLGKLCVRNSLWGRARSFFETSLASGPAPATYQALGDLLATMEEADAAADCYEKGLKLALAD